jgi:hypothetical protein
MSLFCCCCTSEQETFKVKRGRTIPENVQELSLYDTSGQEIKFSSVVQKKLVFISFLRHFGWYDF